MITMLHYGKIIRLNILFVIVLCVDAISDTANHSNIANSSPSHRNNNENIDQIPKEFPTNVRVQSNVSGVEVDGVFKPIKTGQPKGKDECIISIIKAFVNNVIRDNMEKTNSSKSMSSIVHRVEELKSNLTSNLMTLMINLENFHNLLNMELQSNTEKESSPITTPEKKAESDSSISVIVPVLIVIILALMFYIGYLYQKIRTLYYRDANILIEEEL